MFDDTSIFICREVLSPTSFTDKGQMKVLIVIPTYNEECTIGTLLEKILPYDFADILVVDDNSQDRTRDIIKEFMISSCRINMLERRAKLGLGTAYISGFTWGLQRDYNVFFEMDADLSHDPRAIEVFIHEIKTGSDMVVGSRFLNHKISTIGWDVKRLLLSKLGNFYIRKLTPLKSFCDITSGYRCYTRRALEAINFQQIWSHGYAFQIELFYMVYTAGLKISEIPIIFNERKSGVSKMNKRIVLEALLLPFMLLLKRFLAAGGSPDKG